MAKTGSFAEYTKLRDIVVKRNKRAVAAGLAPAIHFPTVKEIKAGLVSPSEAMKAVKNFYSSGSQVKTIRATGLVPEFKSFPSLPPEKPRSSEDRLQRRRDQQREYRRRKRIREAALSPEKARKYEGYLKALQTVSKVWRGKGIDIINPLSMSPSEAQAFVEYMDYRFSQGDFTQRYVIDEFIQDFSKLVKRGYKPQNITKDFEKFLENRSQLSSRFQSMEGMTTEQFQASWYDFIGD